MTDEEEFAARSFLTWSSASSSLRADSAILSPASSERCLANTV